MAPTDCPDVSVVVIVYNDAERLPVAVGSVLDQSLRNVEVIIVDDHSTDGSGAVADRLAASHPGRIRAIHLPENSGGCSRPRNVGIDHARAKYVMLLDSDDEFDRHACRNLFVKAEETNADFVAGRVLRVHVNKRNKITPWFPQVYGKTVDAAGISEFPTMFWDMLSTNKIYRREFLDENEIRFPDGLFYEDMLFATRVYTAAERFSVIPQSVYRWMVKEQAATQSITHRRHEFKNFSDRIHIHREMDRVLDGRVSDDVLELKAERFLRHDLRLYLNDLPEFPDDYRAKFMELAAEYLTEIPDRILNPVLDRIQQPLAIAVFMIRQGDFEGLMTAIDFLHHKWKLSTDLVVRDDRVYWCDRHLDTEEGRRRLDVTAYGIPERPFHRLYFHNRVVSMAHAGAGRVALSGEIVNQLGRIPREGFEVAIDVGSTKPGMQHKAFKVSRAEHHGDRITWQGTIDLAGLDRPGGLRERVWNVRTRLRVAGEENFTPLAVDPRSLPELRFAVQPKIGPVAGDHLEAYATAHRNLAFRLINLGSTSIAVRNAAERVLADPRAVKARRSAGRTISSLRKLRNDGTTKASVYKKVLMKAPIQSNLVVFESHLGKQYSDSPRYIYEELRRRGLPWEVVWAYEDSPKGFPKDATLVKRYSWEHLWALARARYWVDNHAVPSMCPKRPGQEYIQTWHGTALKRMGFDLPSVKRGSQGSIESLRAQFRRWDYFMVRCDHDLQTLVPAFEYTGELLEYGYPRNDLLQQDGRAAARDRVRAALDIPADKRVVLYAPTYRESARNGRHDFDLRIDLEEFRDRLGEDFVLLVRPHYLDTFQIPFQYSSFVRNVADYHDITELLNITDVLVTDYSSLMFDYVLTGRPIVFFTYDYDEYTREERGAYFDLREVAPGPVVEDGDALLAALARVDETHTEYQGAYKSFVDRFANFDKGDAARRVVDRFFAGKQRGVDA
ncbi:CDP-glycerol glycerophosphotransferase family protein [Embleya sp. NPDC008237]|uniref:bifunctional glycosyltransferase/CDP-glycerol:glycerophosphate glycerophosphotransferase n=1 Tax=Embleya sp. NPDC008237 TaxID=3363978 RepID=UPI0036E2CB49